MATSKLRVDHRRRVTLGKYLPENTSSVNVIIEGNRIILEPLTEVPAHEAWLMQNQDKCKEIKGALQQEAKHDLGSFAHYANDNI